MGKWGDVINKFKKTKTQTEEERVQKEINDGFKKLFEAAALLGWGIIKHADKFDGVVIGSEPFLEHIVGKKKSWLRIVNGNSQSLNKMPVTREDGDT